MLATAEKLRRARVIGQGGEGIVYEVQGRADACIKIYHEAPDGQKRAKLAALVAKASNDVAAYAAWPTNLFKDEKGRVVGFVMPRVTGARDIHALYSPKARREHFPKADWRFLVRAAANLAAAVANVHDLGCVIGDVNQSSVLVRPDAQVILIDCDSFQIAAGGKVFRCGVGVPMFTPPEVFGEDLAHLDRTPDHDAFGLAVLIFHLLFLGRHPFAGRPKSAGDVSIEDAIKGGDFAYAPGATRLEPPPHTLPLDALPEEVQVLFRRAFDRAGERPTAADWHGALQRLEASLDVCARNPSHYFTKGRCPWCEIEDRSGAVLFARAAGRRDGPQDPAGLADATPLYQAILAVRCTTVGPAPDPVRIGAAPRRRPDLPPIGFVHRATPFAAAGAALVSAGAGFTFSQAGAQLHPLALGAIAGAAIWMCARLVTQPRVDKVRAELDQDRMLWAEVDRQWARLRATDPITRRLFELRALFDAHQKLVAAERAEAHRKRDGDVQKIAAFEADMRKRAAVIIAKLGQPGVDLPSNAELVTAYEAQRRAYLCRRSITQANIAGIGPTRVAKLASHGIESAGDIDRAAVLAIPGFGADLADALVLWRDRVSRSFAFDLDAARRDVQAGRIQPKQPPKLGSGHKVDRKTLARLRKIEAELAAAPAELRALEKTQEGQVSSLTRLAEERASRLIQSQANAEALGLPTRKI